MRRTGRCGNSVQIGRGAGRRRGDPLQDVLIGMLEQSLQRFDPTLVQPVQVAPDKALQQDVQILHPAPAAPACPFEPYLPGHKRLRERLTARLGSSAPPSSA